jgi:hypothetical protein
VFKHGRAALSVAFKDKDSHGMPSFGNLLP